MEQPGEFVPGTRRAGHCDFEDLADSLHRLPPTLEDFQIIIPCRNWTVLFQGGFCITLSVYESRFTLRARRFPWKVLSLTVTFNGTSLGVAASYSTSDIDQWEAAALARRP